MKVGQNGTTDTAGAKPKGKLEYFNATMGTLFPTLLDLSIPQSLQVKFSDHLTRFLTLRRFFESSKAF
jgi:hypothetical protein